MKHSLLTAILLFVYFFCTSQKIVKDEIKPISGKREIISGILPIFKMNTIQVAAMAEVDIKDTIFSLAFYRISDNSIIIDNKMDTAKHVCIILLENGTKISGDYVLIAEVMGYRIISYKFSSTDFRALASGPATAYSLNVPKFGIMEYSLDKKYKESIEKVCSSILKRLEK